MGCNFFIRPKPCAHCKRCGEEKHIGKSSCGWQFHFKGYAEENIVSYADWLKVFEDENREIVDEYGDVVSLHDFKATVASTKHGMSLCNIILNEPEKDNEREYLDRRSAKYRDASVDREIEEKTWKDPEGYTFTDWEFR